jgi:hypothetical protein
MHEEDEGITRQPDAVQGREDGRPVPQGQPHSGEPTSWEDNPYRKRGLGWEGSFADTGLVPIVALAVLVGPVALVIGVLGGLFMKGPRARKKAWIMAAVAAPFTVLWFVLVSLGKKG